MAKWPHDGPILEFDKLSISFFPRPREIQAVMDFSVIVQPGEAVRLKGESGCGKSTFAIVLMGLETATAGQILLDNRSIGDVPIQRHKTGTVADIQMVFQNPFDTLNPSMTVGRQIIRTWEMFRMGTSEVARRERMLQLLDLVKLPRAFAGDARMAPVIRITEL